MKKVISIMLSVMFLWTVLIAPTVHAEQTPIDIAKAHHQTIQKQFDPKSAYVITQQGQILYDYHGTRTIDPASTAKLMTVYLILEDIKQGKVHLSDKVKITPTYQQMSQLPNLTTFPLKNKQTYTVDQLLKQAMLESSNASTLVLADHVDGDVSKFTDRMNHTAQSLGMQHTHFTNPSGANNQLIHQFIPKAYKNETTSSSTAQDMAILSQALLKQHPEVLNYSKLETDKQYGKTLKNTNLSLPHGPDALKAVEADGLKTGTSENGYNLVLTAKQKDLRINTVVMNVQPYQNDSAKHARQKLANALTEEAFNNYEYRKVISKGEHEIEGKTYDVKHDLYDLVQKDKSKYHLKVVDDKQLKVDYPRNFLKGYQAPSVSVEPVTHWGTLLLGALVMIGGAILLTAIIYIVVKRIKS
ncbi:penicillin-binding protein PBP4 [Staphylococcus simulans]|uniref:penicillin-binding protein PBP4 n=1 Tax=Staphylococcus simulans TaxID=1286 RepID=UPI00399AF1EF